MGTISSKLLSAIREPDINKTQPLYDHYRTQEAMSRSDWARFSDDLAVTIDQEAVRTLSAEFQSKLKLAGFWGCFGDSG